MSAKEFPYVTHKLQGDSKISGKKWKGKSDKCMDVVNKTKKDHRPSINFEKYSKIYSSIVII